jgi:hypothetical protein
MAIAQFSRSARAKYERIRQQQSIHHGAEIRLERRRSDATPRQGRHALAFA